MTARTHSPHWPPRPSFNALVLAGLLQALDRMSELSGEDADSARFGVTTAALAFADELVHFFHGFRPKDEKALEALEKIYLAERFGTG